MALDYKHTLKDNKVSRGAALKKFPNHIGGKKVKHFST